MVIEESRRRRTDPAFQARWQGRTDLVREALPALVRRERAAGRVAPSITDEVATLAAAALAGPVPPAG